ncbi:MAG: hypothetical protein QXI12_02575 [Candidatus Methanomethyliaceae archaeon]
MNLPFVLRSLLRRTAIYTVYRTYQQRRLYREWVRTGRPVPPPFIVKLQTVKDYAREFDLHVFVETGTFMGDMVDGVKDVFDEIYSIELSDDLYREAAKRFARARHITILHGDSGQVLKEVLPRVNQPCLFWLDAHYSGGITAKGASETPIEREIANIFGLSSPTRHVILVDDARCFNGKGDYPSLEALEKACKSVGFQVFEVKDDIIRIHRRR